MSFFPILSPPDSEMEHIPAPEPKPISQTIDEIQNIIDTTDWNQTPASPRLTVTMIEAKAKLMEAVKKLLQVNQNSL